MYRYDEIKSIHFEISSMCQASCPMCARNQNGGSINPLITETNLDFKTYKKIIPENFLKQLESISMCGNFGDPILNNDIKKIIKYTADINPEIKIDIHTNGSLRNTSWWRDFAKILPKNHLVHFALDGLEDTHSIYRIGTNFNKIIKNAEAFISEGGIAQWVFITFKHNEHQIDICRKMAEDLGFHSFMEKQTSRFIGSPMFDVYDKNNNVVFQLESPVEQKVNFIPKSVVDNYEKIFKTTKISCAVEKDKSIYIDAQGYLWPCCFTGGVLYQYSNPNQIVSTFHMNNKKAMIQFLEKFQGIENLNLRKNTIENIINSHQWQIEWDYAFNNNTLPQCIRTCGKFSEPIISQSKDQFLNVEEF